MKSTNRSVILLLAMLEMDAIILSHATNPRDRLVIIAFPVVLGVMGFLAIRVSSALSSWVFRKRDMPYQEHYV